MTTILLAGSTASGKSTLARALSSHASRLVVSTSSFLRTYTSELSDDGLASVGRNLDRDDPDWLCNLVKRQVGGPPCVVDAVRSSVQEASFVGQVIRVNVVSDLVETRRRLESRGRAGGVIDTARMPFMFSRPDFVWDSSRVSLSTAVSVVNQLAGFGAVDCLVGGQYGSEGKGKLAALLAPKYDMLIRSGGPNAGHWVRDRDYEFCFHHIPSGALANKTATIGIAAGATLGPSFVDEVARTGVANRMWVDPNAMMIEASDIANESKLVDVIGSTAQGVGACAARRLLRGLREPVTTAADHDVLKPYTLGGAGSAIIAHMLSHGGSVMLEGTQGSALSLFHGPYPYTTSRDTNVGGLLAEIGVPPSAVRDTWMVCRSFPIRVGGNSGPMTGEMNWETIATITNQDPVLLKSRELTSTTKRQRRVGTFDWVQFRNATQLNRPSKLFLSFADYIDPAAVRVRDWGKLPESVLAHVEYMESSSGSLVAGVSTGRNQEDVCWR